MSKKLILKASVAALLGTALATTAQADDHASVTFSGVVGAHLYLSDTTVDVPAGSADEETGEPLAGAGEEAGARLTSGDVRFNIAAEDTLGAITAFANYRIDADGISGSPITSDATKLGIKGGFGTLSFLDVGPAMEMAQVVDDIHDIADGIPDGIRYDGSFGPVSLGLSFSPENNSDVVSAGVSFSIGGLGLALGADDQDAAMVGATYDLGSVALGLQVGERDEAGITAAEVSTSFGVWGLNLTHSTMEDVNSVTRVTLSAPITEKLEWAARVQSTSPEEGDSFGFVRTSLTYNF